jgi:hypothetical protein
LRTPQRRIFIIHDSLRLTSDHCCVARFDPWSKLRPICRSKLLLQAQHAVPGRRNEARCLQWRPEEQSDATGAGSGCLGTILEIRGKRRRRLSFGEFGAARRFRLAVVKNCGRLWTQVNPGAGHWRLPIAASEQCPAGGDLEPFSAKRHRDRSRSGAGGLPVCSSLQSRVRVRQGLHVVWACSAQSGFQISKCLNAQSGLHICTSVKGRMSGTFGDHARCFIAARPRRYGPAAMPTGLPVFRRFSPHLTAEHVAGRRRRATAPSVAEVQMLGRRAPPGGPASPSDQPGAKRLISHTHTHTHTHTPVERRQRVQDQKDDQDWDSS